MTQFVLSRRYFLTNDDDDDDDDDDDVFLPKLSCSSCYECERQAYHVPLPFTQTPVLRCLV